MLLAGKFKFSPQQFIDKGAFGSVFYGCVVNSTKLVAIKREPADTKPSYLMHESRIFSCLERYNIAVGFPRAYYFAYEDDYNLLVMDLLGPSLEALFYRLKCVFTLKTTLMLGIQMVRRLDQFHSIGFIHRDYKPNNYCVGLKQNRRVLHLIDYGLAKQFMINGEHIAYKEQKALTGTPRYCSINTHLGIEQSRRDDLESLGYIMIYFLRGSLPWQGIRAARKERYERIMEKKVSLSVNELCRGCPVEIKEFLHYSRSLMFEARPDYNYIERLFTTCLERAGYKNDAIFDWEYRGIETDTLRLDDAAENSSGELSCRAACGSAGTLQGIIQFE